MKKTLLAMTVFLVLASAALRAPHCLIASAQSNTAPAISILYPTSNTVFNVSIEGVSYQIIYETNSTLSWVGYSLNGGNNVTVSGNSTWELGPEHIFRSGYNTLTLYANDTAGNWATPQTVTYFVEFYADVAPTIVPSPTLTPLSALTPSPSIPEFPTWILPSIFLVTAFTALTVARNKNRTGRCL